jgi:uncharacterized tellurite resistance protein B-like protein
MAMLAADLSGSDAPPSPPEIEAILEVMFLMAAVDGEVSEEEIRQFAQSCEPLVGEMTEADVEGTLVGMSGLLAEEGWDRRARQVGAVLQPSAFRELAFRMAVAVAMVDDYVAGAEAAAIDTLAGSFGIDPERASQLMRAVYKDLFEE